MSNMLNYLLLFVGPSEIHALCCRQKVEATINGIFFSLKTLFGNISVSKQLIFKNVLSSPKHITIFIGREKIILNIFYYMILVADCQPGNCTILADSPKQGLIKRRIKYAHTMINCQASRLGDY